MRRHILALFGLTCLCGLISLYAASSGGAGSQQHVDAASLLVSTRMGNNKLEAQYIASHGQHRPLEVLATEGAATAAHARAAGSDATATHAAAAAATAAPFSPAAAAAAGCDPVRRPYHTVLTSSSGGYQAWQCRVMHHHWQLQKSRDPCGEMGGFTRLLTSPKGMYLANVHADEIPTVFVEELSGGEARGYVVANRPHSMVQFVAHPEFEARVTEEYVYIAETDHVLLRPLPNLATPTTPAAFDFGYMVAWGQAKIVDKFVPGLGGKTDPVGPSPVIIHKAQLLQMARPWNEFTKKICRDSEAVQALGWVREMWGWAIAAGSLGIKHRVLPAFQYEGGSIGNRERELAWPVPPTPVGPERDGMRYYVFHYTYGIEYSSEGVPVELQVGEWSLDKRHYMGGGAHGPPRDLRPPPACAHDRAFVLRALINNASASLGSSWEGGGGQTDHFMHLKHRGHDLRADAAAARVMGTGPWKLAGHSGKGRTRKGGGDAFRLERLFILGNGWLVSSKGHGRWGPAKGQAGRLQLEICGRSLVVTPLLGETAWELHAESGAVAGAIATLAAPDEAFRAWQGGASVGNGSPTFESTELTRRVEGSGPYQGAVHGSVYLLREGVLLTEGGHGGTMRGLTRWSPAGPKAVRLSGAGRAVVAHFSECWVLRLGPKPSDEAAPPPARYGPRVMEQSLEWIIRPPATMCTDVCGGLTLRKLTAADRAASAAARSAEGCCSFSWAGFGGLRFEPNGELTTPWGKGIWGAPPEEQSASGAALLAEFAGHQHLLTARVELRGEGAKAELRVTGFDSVRCADNDKSRIGVDSGTPGFVPLKA